MKKSLFLGAGLLLLAGVTAFGASRIQTVNAVTLGINDDVNNYDLTSKGFTPTNGESGSIQYAGELAYGHRICRKVGVPLDGLEITIKNTIDDVASTCWGFYLGDAASHSFYSETTRLVFTITGIWSQTRFGIGANHDTKGNSLGFDEMDATHATNSGWDKGAMVMTETPGSQGLTIKFERVDDDWWALYFSEVVAGSFGNYVQGDPNYDPDTNTDMVYLRETDFAGAYDKNTGLTYVNYFGMNGKNYNLNYKLNIDSEIVFNDLLDALLPGSEVQGQCYTAYPLAKAAYDKLTPECRALFAANETEAFERLQAWARANGDVLEESTKLSNFSTFSENTYIFVIAGGLSVAAITCLYFVNKRKKSIR